jgi:hypothetical protein
MYAKASENRTATVTSARQQTQGVHKSHSTLVPRGDGKDLALSRLIQHSRVQPKLVIEKPHDRFEREADQTAERLVQSRPLIQLQPEEKEEEAIQAEGLTQRQAEEEEEAIQGKGLIQRQAEEEVERGLSLSKSGGVPLKEGTRAEMEGHFDADFSSVRLHTDTHAASMSRALSAQAFTQGNHIYFGAGKYDPGSTAGKKLIAHELTHVVQQGAAARRKSVIKTFATRRSGSSRGTGQVRSRPSGPVSRSGSWVQLAPLPQCTQIGTSLKTRKVRDAPRAWYGAQFNHTFDPLSKGCSLKGIQVSEAVSVVQDHFQSGARNIPLGQTIWALTAKHELHRPDHIYTLAGPRGLGVNPLKAWPALLSQDQVWYYRFSSTGPWHLGPAVVINTKLSGDLRKPETLKVTTTDNGVSRTENYRGPAIRLQNP